MTFKSDETAPWYNLAEQSIGSINSTEHALAMGIKHMARVEMALVRKINDLQHKLDTLEKSGVDINPLTPSQLANIAERERRERA